MASLNWRPEMHKMPDYSGHLLQNCGILLVTFVFIAVLPLSGSKIWYNSFFWPTVCSDTLALYNCHLDAALSSETVSLTVLSAWLKTLHMESWQYHCCMFISEEHKTVATWVYSYWRKEHVYLYTAGWNCCWRHAGIIMHICCSIYSCYSYSCW